MKGPRPSDAPKGRPFEPKTAIIFVLVVGLTLLISALLTEWLGDRGLMLAAGVAGFTDAACGRPFRQHRWPQAVARKPEFAALAVLVGFSTNVVSKTVVAFSLGDRGYAYAADSRSGPDGGSCVGCVVGSRFLHLGRSYLL